VVGLSLSANGDNVLVVVADNFPRFAFEVLLDELRFRGFERLGVSCGSNDGTCLPVDALPNMGATPEET